MTDQTENNKRLAKNTLLLYIRMLLTMCVSLYTSRVVLNVLGVNDYGIYNVVGGIISMLSFFNTAMASASQRFISYELGRKNVSNLNGIFSTSIIIHGIIAFIILLLAETVGLWFLNNHLNIDSERMIAANCVYQATVFSFILSVISVPYNACIIAHEQMKAFAYISILETSLKLIIVYILIFINYDKLISYSVLLLCVALVVRMVYMIYCKRNFNECYFRFIIDKALLKKMFSFAGWSLVGNLGLSVKDQGSNIILNIICGTVVNAAKGISTQVNCVIGSFPGYFLMALNPQITKQYASGNIEDSIKLVYLGCRLSFYLFIVISIPLLLKIDYILSLWLIDVPIFTSEFLFFAIISTTISSMAAPIVAAVQATGRIKLFQVVLSIIMFSEIPITYIILKLGFKPYYVMIGTILITFIALIARFVILKWLINSYSLKYFVVQIIIKNYIIFLICYFLLYYIETFTKDNLIELLLFIIISLLVCSLIIFLLGLTKIERKSIKHYIYKKKVIYDKFKKNPHC